MGRNRIEDIPEKRIKMNVIFNFKEIKLTDKHISIIPLDLRAYFIPLYDIGNYNTWAI